MCWKTMKFSCSRKARHNTLETGQQNGESHLRFSGDLCCFPSNDPNYLKGCCHMVVPHIICVTFFDSCWKSFRVLFGLLPAQVVTQYPLLLLLNNCIVDWYSSPEGLPTVLAPTHLSTGSPWCLCTKGSCNSFTGFSLGKYIYI